MDSTVGTFTVKEIVCMDMESSVFEVIKTFASLRFSALPVLDRDGRCFGIVTPKDIFELIASLGDVHAIKAWEICSHTLFYVHPEITAVQACQVMRDNKIHHLMVGDAVKPLGIISTMDIVDQLHQAEMAAFKAGY